MSSFRLALVFAALMVGHILAAAPGHLTSRPAAESKADVVLKVGEKLTTTEGETRRVRLPNSTLVFVRNNTTLGVTTESGIEKTER